MTQQVDLKGSGFAAVSSTPTADKKYAVKKVVVGPDGRPQVVTVDVRTGQTLSDTSGYSMYQNNLWQQPQQEPQSVAENIVKQEAAPPPVNQQINQEGQHGDVPQGTGMGRSQGNSFGYIDKPAGIGALSMAPGMIGMAGKGINAAINANNMLAVNAAQDAMDMPESSGWGNIRDVLKDNKGQVGNYNVNNRTYSVGMEAIDPKTGATNLTPGEAVNRAAWTGTELRPATEQENKQHKTDNESRKGNKFQGLIDRTKSFIDSLFEDDAPSAPASSERTESRGFVNSYDIHESNGRGEISGEGGVDSFGGPDGGDPASDDRLD